MKIVLTESWMEVYIGSKVILCYRFSTGMFRFGIYEKGEPKGVVWQDETPDDFPRLANYLYMQGDL